MTRSLKAILIAVVVLAVLFVVCGIAFDWIFRYISHSFYTNAKQSDAVDEKDGKPEIGREKDRIGYVRSSDYTKAKKR